MAWRTQQVLGLMCRALDMRMLQKLMSAETEHAPPRHPEQRTQQVLGMMWRALDMRML